MSQEFVFDSALELRYSSVNHHPHLTSTYLQAKISSLHFEDNSGIGKLIVVMQSEGRNSRAQFLLFCLLLGVIILSEYGESFNFYFVGDDFAFIEFMLAEKAGILWKSPSFFHYYPLGVLFNALPACFGVLDPQWYVLVSFLSYWACSILVMMIFRSIAGSRMGGLLAALMFSTALPNSEVIYWKTGNQTIAMTFFSLLALLLFIRYLNNGSKWNYMGCMVSFVASMLCIEQGSVMFGILFLYDLLFFSGPQLIEPETNKKGVVFGLLRRQSILVCIPILLSWLKSSLGYSLLPIPLSAVSFLGGAKSVANTLIRLLDFNQMFFSADASFLAISSITILLLSLFAGYIAVKRNMAATFFLLASTSSILVISSLGGGPNPRYFCLPLVFYTCFLSIIFEDIAGLFARGFLKLLALISSNSRSPKGGSGLLNGGLHFVLCLVIIQTGLSGNFARREYWKAASLMQQNMLNTIESLFRLGTIRREKGQKLFLLNIPAAIKLEKYSQVYVAQNSFIPDLRHRVGELAEEIEVIAVGTQFRIPFGEDWLAYRPVGWKSRVSQNEIQKIIEDGHVIFQFSPFTRTLVPISDNEWGASQPGDTKAMVPGLEL